MSLSSSSFGYTISPLSASTDAAKQSSPDSTGLTKKRLIPSGQLSGCFFAIRFSHPIGSEPFEKATFAKRAVLMGSLSAYAIIVSSISFFVAPITLTGFAALSVETQKKCCGGFSSKRSRSFFAIKTFVSHIASMECTSLSARTCLRAAKLATISNGPCALKNLSKSLDPRSIGSVTYSTGTQYSVPARNSRVSSVS